MRCEIVTDIWRKQVSHMLCFLQGQNKIVPQKNVVVFSPNVQLINGINWSLRHVGCKLFRVS